VARADVNKDGIVFIHELDFYAGIAREPTQWRADRTR